MTKAKLYNFSASEAVLLIISLLSISGALVYKLYSLNSLGVLLTLAITGLASYIIYRYSTVSLPKLAFNFQELKAELIFLTLWLASLTLLIQARGGEAISTPWQVIHPVFFPLFTALSLSLLYITATARRHWLLALSLYLFICYHVAVIVYGLGYGFDPFIHQATLKFIDQFGAVSPKPFYYSGQYALEIVAHKLSHLPLAWIDKLLVPTLSASLLPAIFWHNFQNIFDRKQAAQLSIVLICAALTSFFLISTPQNLAYFFLTALIASSMSSHNKNWLLNYSLALAALVTQPVAGIPALLAVSALQLYTSSLPYRRVFAGFALSLSALLLPLSFFFIDKTYNLSGSLRLSNFSLDWLSITLPNSASPWLNFASAWASLLAPVIIILAFAGLFFNSRLKASHANYYHLYFWQGLALIVAYLLTKIIAFNFLIDYERDNYANRMLVCAIIFWLPLISIGLYEFIQLVLAAESRQKITWAIVTSIILSATLYISYPRQDAHLNSHSYASSVHDLAAVTWINDDAAGADYIVLANQQVSAAALHQYGFAKYYDNNTFYYPIPTGGPLYQYYLSLVKTPDLNTIKSAGSLVGVHQVYVVINEYWWQARRLITEFSLLADDHYKVAGGKVHVFKFTW
jgi:hypothetical protein